MKKNLLMPPKKKKFNINATKVKRSRRISLINEDNKSLSPHSSSMVVSHNISGSSSQISYNSLRSRGSKSSHFSRRSGYSSRSKRRKMRSKFKRGKVVLDIKNITRLRNNSETPRVEVPAGRPYNKRNELLTLTKNANVELNHSICDVKGKTPIFGYPPL